MLKNILPIYKTCTEMCSQVEGGGITVLNGARIDRPTALIVRDFCIILRNNETYAIKGVCCLKHFLQYIFQCLLR